MKKIILLLLVFLCSCSPKSYEENTEKEAYIDDNQQLYSSIDEKTMIELQKIVEENKKAQDSINKEKRNWDYYIQDWRVYKENWEEIIHITEKVENVWWSDCERGESFSESLDIEMYSEKYVAVKGFSGSCWWGSWGYYLYYFNLETLGFVTYFEIKKYLSSFYEDIDFLLYQNEEISWNILKINLFQFDFIEEWPWDTDSIDPKLTIVEAEKQYDYRKFIETLDIDLDKIFELKNK